MSKRPLVKITKPYHFRRRHCDAQPHTRRRRSSRICHAIGVLSNRRGRLGGHILLQRSELVSEAKRMPIECLRLRAGNDVRLSEARARERVMALAHALCTRVRLRLEGLRDVRVHARRVVEVHRGGRRGLVVVFHGRWAAEVSDGVGDADTLAERHNPNLGLE